MIILFDDRAYAAFRHDHAALAPLKKAAQCIRHAPSFDQISAKASRGRYRPARVHADAELRLFTRGGATRD